MSSCSSWNETQMEESMSYLSWAKKIGGAPPIL